MGLEEFLKESFEIYCEQKEFNLSNEDSQFAYKIGWIMDFEDWQDNYENSMCDGSIVATVDVDDYMLIGAMRSNDIPVTKENFAKCKEYLKNCITDAMAMEMNECLDAIMSNYEG